MANDNLTTKGQYLLSVKSVASVLPWRKFRWSLTLRTFVIDADGQGYPEQEREYELYSGYAATHAGAWRKARQRRQGAESTNQFFTEFENPKEN